MTFYSHFFTDYRWIRNEQEIIVYVKKLSTFPTDVIEAARIDGGKEFTIFFRIVAPSMRSCFAAGAIWTFMNQWNNFWWPLLVLQSNEQKALTLVLNSLSSAYFVEYGGLMAAILIATAPVIIVFLMMQKHFVARVVGGK